MRAPVTSSSPSFSGSIAGTGNAIGTQAGGVVTSGWIQTTTTTGPIPTWANANGAGLTIGGGAGGNAFVVAKQPLPPPEPMVAELFLYDAIGADFFGDGITAKAVLAAVQEVERAGATNLEIRINSPGGDVFEATAIYNALDRFKGKKSVFIDGLAASAASYVAMVGDTITTAPNAMWMVHDPWGLCVGNAADMREAADLLDKVAGTLVGTYVRRTGMADAEIRAIMQAETWMNADEALAKGFTDAIGSSGDGDDPDSEDQQDQQDERAALSARSTALLARYAKTPAALRPDARALIASMEARACPRQSAPAAGAVAKK